MGVLVQHYIPEDNNKKTADLFYGQWMATQKAKLQAEIQEIIDAAESHGYAMWMIAMVLVNVISLYSSQLKNDIALPLEHFQNISKYHSIIKEKLNKIRGNDGRVTEEDAKELAKAIKDLDEALEALRQQYEPTDPSIPENKQWPKGVKEIYDRLRGNLDMILDEEYHNGGNQKTVAEMIESGDWKAFSLALDFWKREESVHNRGPFLDWESGKNGADGLVTVRLILDTEVSTYTDRLNRDSQIIISLQSAAQKFLEYSATLLNVIVDNYRKQ
ncbi:MAG: hypothetical protein PVI40_08180 [Chlamydiota bacterium]|jgi:hypothetical protein